MHLYRYENENLKKYDQVREFCLSEKVDDEYMRFLIMRDCRGGRGIKKMERKQVGREKVLLYGAVILLLLTFQEVLGKLGRGIADIFSYEKFDPCKAYAWISVHHITEMLLALVTILILSKLFNADFGFGLGDRKKGTKYVVMYTTIFAGVTLIVHILMLMNHSLPVYDFPLNKNDIIGTLGFQLLLSGPAEEILYRALPITMLVYVMRNNIIIKWGVTLETIIASFLFAIAHMKWSLFPFFVEADYFRLLYAFAQGTILGKAYQDSRSIIYPMFIHSISNVLMVGTGYLFLLL